MRPLADKIRPKTLDEVVGQKHLVGPNGIIRRIIESKNIPNMIFYGPSGTGKTTIANIIASLTNKALYKINATSAGSQDIKDVINQIGTLNAQNADSLCGRFWIRTILKKSKAQACQGMAN